jgi:hypothetical protein
LWVFNACAFAWQKITLSSTSAVGQIGQGAFFENL